MNRRLIHAVLLLPGNVLVVIPCLIGWAVYGTEFGIGPVLLSDFTLWPGIALASAGLFFGIWTMRLFAATGDGTPAPWDPIKRLIVTGPYLHVRNPMITGVILVLFGEALIFRSTALLAWAALFFFANMVYLPVFEEPGLEKRYGPDYSEYKKNVPRWLPRLRPWRG